MMEVIVSAVLGDIISRSVSFFVDRYRRLQTGGAEESLRRLLLRVQAIVEEAERRDITNQAMLRQLDTLRHGMYRGYYVLDVFTAKDEVRDDSFTLCRFSPAKRLCLSARTPKSMLFGGKGHNVKLREVLSSLEMTVADMEEFVLFLNCYPPMCREPCSSYLVVSDMCMFGRHTEYERIVSFLLQRIGTGNLSVLPIVGPVRVGKSTLVEHVCYDGRVRGSFSSIVFFSGDDLEGMKATANALQDSGVIKYRSGASHGRLLIILELIGDLEEETWRRFCSLLSHMAHGSKVIVTSRSERIVQFGTTQALKLNALPEEAYWYYFKSIALTSAGPEDYSELSSIAMDIAPELKASFGNAHIVGTILRANPDVLFWREVLKHIRECSVKNLLLFGQDPLDLLQKGHPVYLWRMTGSSEVLIAHRCYQVCSSAQHEVPKLTLHDILCGRAIPRKSFEVLAWKSQIPPYYSYLVSCSIMSSRHVVVKKKRSRLQSI
ncbi:unnamed protein product [Alopecurus aequalis]